MRILFVNWVDYTDRLARGGGVSVYQRNLIAALAGRPGVRVSFLASGLAHAPRPGPPRVVPLSGGPRDGCARFQLVDSGVLAPSHADFGNPAQVDHPPTVAAFADFVRRTGPYDVIHFNNLEGLPAAVLALGATWPGTRQILSLHNYYPVCPQVNLWQDEARNCTDFRGGAACTTCLPLRPNRRMVRAAYALEWQMQRLGVGPGSPLFDRAIRPAVALGWRSLRGLLGRHRAAAILPRPGADRQGASKGPVVSQLTGAADDPPSEGRAFARRRERMVALINAHVHRVLCVSDRVRQIALDHGIAPELAVSCPIGSDHAEAWNRTAPRPSFLAADGTLRLAYLGYMRRDKGFPFLMRALAELPADHARRLHLIVAARRGEAEMLAALNALRPRLASLTHLDGYRRDDLDSLLTGVDLGVVPVMWEDNLPQVAIEMHARHIPLLCSDLGGARELGRCPELVFRAGDSAEFARRLGAVLDGALTPAESFRHARPPVTPEGHLEALLENYSAPADATA